MHRSLSAQGRAALVAFLKGYENESLAEYLINLFPEQLQGQLLQGAITGENFASETVARMERLGLIHDQFFLALIRDIPTSEEQILQVAHSCGITWG